MEISTTHGVSHYQELVRRYRVLWSILPKRLPEQLNGQRIGFDLELWGTHDHPPDDRDGECAECRRMVAALGQIATLITPAECHFRTTGGEPVDRRSSSSPRNGFGRSVKLGVEVICRSGHPAVKAECDAGCFVVMREKLTAIGARRV